MPALPEMLKPIPCRLSNASSSGRYSWVSAITFLQCSRSIVPSPVCFDPFFALSRRQCTHATPSQTRRLAPDVPPIVSTPTATDSKRIAASCQTEQASFITPYRNHHGHHSPPLSSASLSLWPWRFRNPPTLYGLATLSTLLRARV